MKKLICLFLIAVMTFGLFGCSKSNNELFTDEFFADVVEIRDLYSGVASGEEMKPAINYLKSLKLVKLDEPLSNTDQNGELLYGLGAISFIKSDGTEIVLLRNHLTINSPDGKCAYTLADETGNLNDELEEILGPSVYGDGIIILTE